MLLLDSKIIERGWLFPYVIWPQLVWFNCTARRSFST